MTLRLSSLYVHPLKSSSPHDLAEAEVLPRGLRDDRSWMVVDTSGRMVTARTSDRLLHVVASTPGTTPGLTAPLVLTAPGLPPVEVAEPLGAPVPVRVHSEDLWGVDAGDAAAAWLSTALGRDDVRLVWCDDPTRRSTDPRHSGPGDHTAFADSFPVTLASTSSLRRLDEWIAAGALERGEEVPPPLSMSRFRPNLVVEGAEPFVEDGWRRVRVGEVTFRVAKPCSRCVVTTVDPVTLARGKEPVRTMARHRRLNGKTRFAVHLVPETTGTVRVGDEVVVDG